MSNGRVVVHLCRGRHVLRTREGHALLSIARTLSELKGYEFAGCPERYAAGSGAHCYFVPDETLVADDAARLGIRSSQDLFGGVVPYEFVKTKAITHTLADERAERPRGWSSRFAARVRDVVLPGFTAFTRRDARAAASRLLRDGPVRIKRPHAAGGRDQVVARSLDEVCEVVETLEAADIARAGLVLETNLVQPRTISVGQVEIDDLIVSYSGDQRLTTDNGRRVVYGGSDLTCIRGGWDALEKSALTPQRRRAVVQARRYDEATEEYPGIVLSRRNYDVAQGVDARGRWISGVLEQGWRCGGASGAEVLALEAFRRNPELRALRVSAVERYGNGVRPPDGAIVHFAGVDPEAGPMMRYVILDAPRARAA
jgi:uncharacterized protein DUF3182